MAGRRQPGCGQEPEGETVNEADVIQRVELRSLAEAMDLPAGQLAELHVLG
jgi:hypothetical protein